MLGEQHTPAIFQSLIFLPLLLVAAGAFLYRKAPRWSVFIVAANFLLINGLTSWALFLEEGAIPLANILGGLTSVFVCNVVLIAEWSHLPRTKFWGPISFLVLGSALAVIVMAFSAVYCDSSLYDTVHHSVIHGNKLVAFYFSAVTLTTLGYGDFVPAVDFVRIVAAAEAIFGYLFFGLLIASLASAFRTDWFAMFGSND